MLKKSALILILVFLFAPVFVFATAPNAGGATTVVSPTNESAVSVNEDAVQPESANIRLIVPTLTDPAGETPNSIRIISVTGGTLWQSNGADITLGSSGTVLSLASGKVDFRFRPDAGRDTNATFQYVVVDPHSSSVNSSASTATISITAVNDAPVMQTATGGTGIGLAATYYIDEWDLTGATYRRIDSTVNFANDFGVPGLDVENFSVRWTGKVKSPVTGNVTFSTASDDGVRLWVNDNLVINNWTLHGETIDTASPVTLVAGELYNIRMEFYERGGGEVARLRWAYTGQATQVIPQAYLYPAITRPTLSYVTNSGAVVIDDAITLSDEDSSSITGGTVEITSNYQSGEDSLVFTNQNGITGSYLAGVLTLSGSATVSQYQAALRTVRYSNSSGTPTDDTRTVEFTVSDGQDSSNSTYRDVGFSAVNSAPVITQGASVSVTMDEDSSPTAFTLTLAATDADYHSVTWSISSQASHGTAVASGTGDSISVGYTPTANYFGSDSFVIQASDGIGADTITVNITINDRTPPVLSSVASASVSSTAATITWTSNENASTRVTYGVASAYGLTTAQTDTSPRVTSHSVNLTGLMACTKYHYAVVSVDAGTNSATSSDNTFTTDGCEAQTSATSTAASTVTVSAGGSTNLTSGNSTINVSAPANFTDDSSSVVIQVKSIDGTTVLATTGQPSESPRSVGAVVFDVTAIINNTTVLDSFDAPVTISYTYADEDMQGINESTLWLYHYHGGQWVALDDCDINMDSNSITCTTDGFSVFGLFGQSAGNGAGGPPPSGIPNASVAHPPGTLILENGTIYLMTNSGRAGFRNEQEYLSYGYQFKHVVPALSADLAKPVSSVLKAMEGTLVLDLSDNRTVYMIGLDGTKRGFASLQIFADLGYTLDNLFRIDLSDYTIGAVIDTAADVHPEGALVLANDGDTVWWIRDGRRHGFESEAVFNTYGFSFNRAVRINSHDLDLPEGSLMKFRDGTLVSDSGIKYIISNGQRTGFISNKAFDWYGYKVENLIIGNLSRYESGPSI